MPYKINSSDSDVDESALSMSPGGLPAPDQKLEVEMRGHEVDQEDIFEIKTRRYTNRIDMEDILPRLWITQTPNFLEAYYDQPGIFLNPKIRSVKPEVGMWERNNSAALSRFHAVLTRIRDIVGDSETGCVEVSWQGSGPLKITFRHWMSFQSSPFVFGGRIQLDMSYGAVA